MTSPLPRKVHAPKQFALMAALLLASLIWCEAGVAAEKTNAGTTFEEGLARSLALEDAGEFSAAVQMCSDLVVRFPSHPDAAKAQKLLATLRQEKRAAPQLSFAVDKLTSDAAEVRQIALAQLTENPELGAILLRQCVREGSPKGALAAIDILKENGDLKALAACADRLKVEPPGPLAELLIQSIEERFPQPDQPERDALGASLGSLIDVVRTDATLERRNVAGLLLRVLSAKFHGQAHPFDDFLKKPGAFNTLKEYVRRVGASKTREIADWGFAWFDMLGLASANVPIGFTLPTVSASGTVHYVSPYGKAVPPFTSWTTAATNIAPAVDAAAAGDTVAVLAGTYTQTNEILITNAITVMSAGGTDYTNTIVTGCGTGRIFNLTANAVIDGFTIRNGTCAAQGGGVLMTDGTVRHCLLTQNTAISGGGGGLCLLNGLVTNCVISSNTALADGSGGGILMLGGLVANCQILDNHATGGGDSGGGGIGIVANTLAGANVSSCLIAGNTASGSGGGVNINSWSGPQLVQNCIFSNNLDVNGVSAGYAMFTGVFSNCMAVGNRNGGIGLRDGGRSIRCLIRNNTGAGASYRGGTFQNCLICNNTGDGVRCCFGGSVEHCTIADNGGCGVVLNGNGKATLMNNIICSNATGCCSGDDLANTAWHNNCTSAAIPAGAVLSSNIVANPQFAAPASGNYHLLPSSPCIDAGMDLTARGVTTDIVGIHRPLRNGFDIGCYEEPDAARH